MRPAERRSWARIAGAGFLPSEVSLDVQSTNVYGTLRKFSDHWGEPFVAREFRAPIRFREAGDFEAMKLATAARASASFPGAFEPAEIKGDGAKLAGYPGKVSAGDRRRAARECADRSGDRADPGAPGDAAGSAVGLLRER